MSLKYHPYNGIQDFIIMTSILAIGRKIAELPYYVHTGDLSWWMFYGDDEPTRWPEHIFLWEHNGKPCGWSLIDPEWCSFDVYLLPEMRGTKEETYILDWTIHNLIETIGGLDGHQIRTLWVSEYDGDHIDQLKRRGFIQDESFMWYMEHPLNGHIPELRLPSNCLVRPILGEAEIYKRAEASYNAFKSTRRFDEYWPRYQRFMRSPVYNPNFDLVTEAPDGQFASFCIIWPDPVNRIGLFEPVGTHSQFQRKGFGKAVITEGLRTLEACGMNQAMVCAEHDNQAALELYQAVGFKIKHKLLTFNKSV